MRLELRIDPGVMAEMMPAPLVARFSDLAGERELDGLGLARNDDELAAGWTDNPVLEAVILD
jgi:hypothetical protein